MARRPAEIARRDNPALLLGLGAVAVWTAWAYANGGHSASDWGLPGLVLVGLLALGIATVPGALEREPLRLLALGALWAFVAWNFLSLLWADFPGDAWAGADKALLYATGFTLLALWSWTWRGVVVVLGALVAGAVVLAVVTLADLALAADPAALIRDGRVVGPVDYANGSVAFFTIAFWPALHIAGRRSASSLVRAAGLGSAVLLLSLGILGQSRGWLFALALVLPLSVLLVRERLRWLLALGLAGLALAPIVPALLQVFQDSRAGLPVESAVDRAAVLALLSGLWGAAVGYGWVLLDRRVRPGPLAVRRIGTALSIAAALALVGGLAAGARAVGDPADWLSEQWSEFSSGDYPSGDEGSRFTGPLGTNRYDEWRVAWNEFVEHPALGLGTDNYQAAYLRERDNPDYSPRYPHSLPLRLLSQLGVVGALLFGLAASLAVVLAWRRRSGSDAENGSAVAVCLVAFAYWAAHGGVDWLWELPALAGPALGLLALAGSRDTARSAPAGSRRPATRLLLLSATAAVSAAVGASLAFPWLADEYQQAGASVWRSDHETAIARLERAARLNPLEAEPLLVAGLVATIAGDSETGERVLRSGLRREPENWFGHLELAVLLGAEGRFGEAEAAIRAAKVRNPRDPVVVDVERAVRERDRVVPRDVYSRYLAQLNRSLGRVEDPGL